MEPTELHPDLRALAFLLGTWRGEGVGGYPTIEDFRFGQELSFAAAPAGRPVLAYTSRSWAVEGGRPLATETGWWRPQPNGALEVTLAHPTGIVEIWVGVVTGNRVELATDLVARTTTAKAVSAGRRLYAVVSGELLWAYDMAAVGQPQQPHVSAALRPA